jgi:PAS domain S-box-containing protein
MAVKDASGRYQFANPKFEQSFGFESGQAIGKTDLQLFPEAVCDLFRESELEAMRLRKGIEREETLPLAGGARHFLVVRFPLFDDDGAITGTLLPGHRHHRPQARRRALAAGGDGLRSCFRRRHGDRYRATDPDCQ